MQAEDFVGRFSFNLNVFGNLWEQIAKFRAARKLWAKMLREEYGVQDKKKLFLRGLFGGGGSGLTKEQPENNIMRGAFYALGAALSGAQTTALCSFDEAYTIPTPRAAFCPCAPWKSSWMRSGCATRWIPWRALISLRR